MKFLITHSNALKNYSSPLQKLKISLIWIVLVLQVMMLKMQGKVRCTHLKELITKRKKMVMFWLTLLILGLVESVSSKTTTLTNTTGQLSWRNQRQTQFHMYDVKLKDGDCWQTEVMIISFTILWPLMLLTKRKLSGKITWKMNQERSHQNLRLKMRKKGIDLLVKGGQIGIKKTSLCW